MVEGECYGGRWLRGWLSAVPGVVVNAVVVAVACLVPALVIVVVVVTVKLAVVQLQLLTTQFVWSKLQSQLQSCSFLSVM